MGRQEGARGPGDEGEIQQGGGWEALPERTVLEPGVGSLQPVGTGQGCVLFTGVINPILNWSASWQCVVFAGGQRKEGVYHGVLMSCDEGPTLSIIFLEARGTHCTYKTTQKSAQSLGPTLPFTFQYIPTIFKQSYHYSICVSA